LGIDKYEECIFVVVWGAQKKDNISKKRVINGGQGVLANSVTLASTVEEGTWTEEEFGSNWYREKTRGLWTNAVVLYTDEEEKQDEGF
jgi:hypothetical protein